MSKDKEPSLCFRKRGTVTVEAAVVIPLVTLFLVSILYFFRVLSVQAEVQQALCYASQNTAVAVKTIDTPPKQLGYAKVRLMEALYRGEDVSAYILGGYTGVSLASSIFTEEYICLQATYQIPYPFGVFSLPGITVYQESKSRRWIGQQVGEEDKDTEYFFITETGTVYHTSSKCKYLDLSIQEVDYAKIKALRNKSAQKYKPCAECAAKKTYRERVYITDYGTRYHADITCSGLKRTVYKIHKSEIGSRKKCSKCGK